MQRSSCGCRFYPRAGRCQQAAGGIEGERRLQAGKTQVAQHNVGATDARPVVQQQVIAGQQQWSLLGGMVTAVALVTVAGGGRLNRRMPMARLATRAIAAPVKARRMMRYDCPALARISVYCERAAGDRDWAPRPGACVCPRAVSAD